MRGDNKKSYEKKFFFLLLISKLKDKIIFKVLLLISNLKDKIIFKDDLNIYLILFFYYSVCLCF